jgi:hypothetical protein
MDPVLDALCQQIATLLAQSSSAGHNPVEALPDVSLRIEDHLRSIYIAMKTGTAPAPITLTPEFIEWAKKEFTEEEAIAGLREIRETGGLTFEDVIRGLETPATND